MGRPRQRRCARRPPTRHGTDLVLDAVENFTELSLPRPCTMHRTQRRKRWLERVREAKRAPSHQAEAMSCATLGRVSNLNVAEEGTRHCTSCAAARTTMTPHRATALQWFGAGVVYLTTLLLLAMFGEILCVYLRRAACHDVFIHHTHRLRHTHCTHSTHTQTVTRNASNAVSTARRSKHKQRRSVVVAMHGSLPKVSR